MKKGVVWTFVILVVGGLILSMAPSPQALVNPVPQVVEEQVQQPVVETPVDDGVIVAPDEDTSSAVDGDDASDTPAG